MPQRRAWGAALVLIGAAGLALRFVGLAWGLPFELHPDEPVILGRVEQMAWNSLNPGFFVYPGFFLYQLFLLGRLLAAAGAGHADLILAARSLTALYASATVLFAYLLGARLGGRLLGTIAAGLVALTGALTLHAHYGVTDTPATALATATLWLSVRGWQRRSFGGLLAAAAMAGLAVSTKYSVAPVCFVPWVGFLALASRCGASAGKRVSRTAALAAVAVTAFLVTSPFTLLDYEGFLRDIRAESRLQVEGRPGEHVGLGDDAALSERGLVGNAATMYEDLGAAAMIMALSGLAVSLVGGVRSWGSSPQRAVDLVGGLMVAIWVLLYFAMMAPSAKYGQRYVVPIYPATMILAALPVVLALPPRGEGERGVGRIVAASLIVAVALPTSIDAVRSTILLAQRDTRLVARDWAIANLEPGSRLAREFYAPPFHESDGFRLMQPFALTDLDLETYCRDGVDYLILSSLNADRYASDPVLFADELAWYDGLDTRSRLVHRVDGVGDLSLHHPTIEVRQLYCRPGDAGAPDNAGVTNGAGSP